VALNSSRTDKKKTMKAESSKGVRARLSTTKQHAVKKSARAQAATVSMTAVDVPALRQSVKTTAKSIGPKVRVKAVVSQARKAVKPVRARRAAMRTELVASEIAQAMLGEMDDTILEREAQRSQRERELLARLAGSMQRTDDMPNLELAAELVQHDDESAVAILIGVLERHDLEHAGDCARVLCEVGTRSPDLLLRHAERLLSLCDESQKDVLPFTMFAFSPVAHRHAEALWDMRDLFWSALADLTQPADMAQAGAVKLLSALCAAGPDYARTLAGGLVDLLGKCMPKDVAFFAESVLPALGTAHSHRAKPVLDRRMKELTPAEVARLRRAVRAAQTGQPLFAAA
jgi:hypothetical protein